MKIWWITLGLTFILCIYARIYAKKVQRNNGEIMEYKPNKMFSFLACSILILVSGLRINIGDTQTYIQHFEKLSSNFRDTLILINSDTQDIGFTIFSAFIKDYISENSQVYILIISTITIALIFITLYKYCGMLELGVFIFITAGNYLVSMNGVRQYLVSAILFYAFPLIYKKNWKVYFTIVLILSTIHGSAIIFIPLYFIVDSDAWGRVSVYMIITGILAYIFYPITAKVFAGLLQETQYGIYSAGILSGNAGSSNIIRTLVYIVPIVFSYIKRKEIKENERYFNIVLNFSILNSIFMLLSSGSSWIFARYCMYFSLYMIILLCWCIKYISYNKERRLVYYLCIALFGIYYFYEMHISLNQIYMSNFIHF